MFFMENILLIYVHPDDETLGMGGTIKKLSKNNEITRHKFKKIY